MSLAKTLPVVLDPTRMAGSATDPSLTSTAAPSAPLSGVALRAQIIEEMSTGSGTPAVEVAPKAEPAAQPVEEPEPDLAEAAPVETDDSDEDTDVEDEGEETPSDPETAKRLDVVRRAEKRMRAQVEAKEADLDAREKRMADRIARADEIDRLAARAKYDPGAVFRALGLTEDDFESVAHALYSESKVGQSDPKRKEAAAKLLRDREQADKVAAAEKRMADLEKKLETQQYEAQARAEAARYFEQMNQAATTSHPAVAHLLKVDPDETAQGLVASYDALMKKGGKPPPPAAVVKHFEAAQRARFKRLGFDIDAAIGAKPTESTSKTNGKAAPIVIKGNTFTNGNGKATREEILAELASLSD